VRPASLLDPSGWEVADAFGFGPSLWVAPVIEDGARERDVWLPPGDWIEAWSGERVRGGREVLAAAPLHATLWGEPPCGRALARLADGTVVRWRRGRWECSGRGDVTFEER